MVLLDGRRYQHRTDEVFARGTGIDLFVDIFQQLVDFFFGPNIFALIIRNDVEAFSKRFLNAVLVIFLCAPRLVPFRSNHLFYLTVRAHHAVHVRASY